jgi:hypothetical protein
MKPTIYLRKPRQWAAMFVVLLAFALGIIRRDAYVMPETHVETDGIRPPTGTENVLNAGSRRGRTINESVTFTAKPGFTVDASVIRAGRSE